MKIILAVILTCSVLTMCGGQECTDERVKACFDENSLGKAFSGEATPKLSELCDSTMKLKAAGDCLVAVLTECKWTTYFNMTRMKNAPSRICANRSADCSDESMNRLALCNTELQSRWMENKGSTDEMTATCELNGGIKKCIMDNLVGSCDNGKKALDLFQSFSKTNCLPYDRCSICWRSSSTSTISASFIVIAGFLMLSNFFVNSI